MKRTSDTDFDLMVRSVMENAEEAVPGSVWEGISTRMDAAGTKVTAIRLIRRIGLSLAIAGVCVGTALVIMHPDGIENASESILPLADNYVGQSAVHMEKTASETVPQKQLPVTATETTSPEKTVPERTIPQERTALQERTAPQEQNAPQEQITPQEQTPSSEEFLQRWPQEQKRITKSRVQLAVLTGTGGNAGKHHYSIGRSSSRAVDFGSAQITENECTFVSIPVSLGIGIKIHFNDHWALGTGITYTYLGRKFSGTFDDGAVEKYSCPSITNDQHYLGIPVNLYFCFASANRLNFYAFAGGSVDRCISNRYWFNYAGTPMRLKNKVKGLQYSVNLGCGMQYDLNGLLSIYLDPEMKYFFNDKDQPKSIRTTQPFQFGCELGLRFNL